MKAILTALGAAMLLAGCVVAPVRGEYRVRPEVAVEVVAYPQYERDYYWDSRANLYFFYGPRHEVRYMPCGWPTELTEFHMDIIAVARVVIKELGDGWS